jgi:hypothetical protein
VNPVVPPDPDAARRSAEVLELWAKVAGGLAIVWGFVEKVAKPYQTWRKHQLAAAIDEVISPKMAAFEQRAAERNAYIVRKLNEWRGDHDHMIEVVLDNRERHNELNDLLSELGLSSERRHDHERRALIDAAMSQLQQRQRERRMIDDDDPPYHSPP